MTLDNLAYNTDSLLIDIDDFNDNSFTLSQSIESSKETLQELKRKSILLNGEFEDDIWLLRADQDTYQQTTVTFSDISDDSLKIQVKCWAVIQLKNIHPLSVHTEIVLLVRFINLTDSLNASVIEESVGDIVFTNFTDTGRPICLSCAISFMEFIEESSSINGVEYESTLNKLRAERKKFPRVIKRRQLPPYRDVIRFAFILTTFAQKWSKNEKMRFFPILLWWKITSIIPMRPSEFCLIKKDCLPDNKKGVHYLELPRKKQPSSSTHLAVNDKLPISKEVAELISEYKELTSFDSGRETLISYEAYSRTFPGNNIKTRNYTKTIRNPKAFDLTQFQYILDGFYEDVLKSKMELTPISKKEYNELEDEIAKKKFKKINNDEDLEPLFPTKEIVRISPGDTRHFAICNMMLQGIDRLTIARMAGHRHIETQYNYQGHLEYFIDSKVYELTLLNNVRSQIQYSTEDFETNLSLKDIAIRSLAPKEMFGPGDEPVEIGICTDPQMRCESNVCVLCSKNWIPLEEYQEHVSELIELKYNLKKKLKIKQSTLLRIYSELSFEYGTERIDPLENEELKRAAKQLNGEMHDYATLLDKMI